MQYAYHPSPRIGGRPIVHARKDVTVQVGHVILFPTEKPRRRKLPLRIIHVPADIY